MTDAAALQIEGLRKTYRQLVAVDDLSVTIDSGEFVGLIGPNGAGKSTTMNCVAGTIVPDTGEVRVDGVDVQEEPVESRRHIGFVPQELSLYRYLTGQEFLLFVADVRGVERDIAHAEIDELFELTELTDARDRIVNEYSGGMQRKLGICSALVGSPRLLLLDESFVGLDPESTHRIRRRLLRHCESGGAIVLSSHILDMLERICSRVVMLADGKLKFDRTIEDLRGEFADGEHDNLTELYLAESGKELEL